ncbi:MAG: hypothetical protein HY210_02335 [Candidatus Omnitrophica bacterium]|nr:hypothetical protein [Candidatus Omnitrophota bacterium]
MAKTKLFASRYNVVMKVSEQIKCVGGGWFLYGMGSLLMRVFGIEPFEYVFLDFANMIFGLGLYFKIKILMKIGRVYLWIFLLAICSFPFGARADFGVDSQLTATQYFVPMVEITFLLWFLRRICVIRELVRDKNDPAEEQIYGLGEQLAVKSPFIWWFGIIFLTSGIWSFLLPK